MRQTLKQILLIITLSIVSNSVLAHGGVSVEQDKCVLTIGPYRMHFTGYQPESSGGQEFCEDIPVVGSAIIVLDYVDEALRSRMTSFKIIEKNSWSEAQSIDGDEQAKAIIDVPAQLYKRGSMKFDYKFTQPGYFVGFVTSQGESSEDKLISRFPFAVGYGASGVAGSNRTIIYGAIAAGLIALLGYFYMKSRKSIA
jgi:hypothetical protein